MQTDMLVFGTVSPEFKLHVADRMKLDGASAGLWIEASSNDWFIGRSGDNLRFYNNGDKVTIIPSGNVGIGTSNPIEKLHLNGVLALGTSELPFRMWVGVSGSNHHLRIGTDYGHYGDAAIEIYQNYAGGAGSQPGKVAVNGNLGVGTSYPSYRLDVAGTARATAWYTTSDERVKRNIRSVTTQIDLKRIKAYQYEMEDGYDDGRTHFGLLAQEVEEVYPHMVQTDSAGIKSVAYQEFIPILIQKAQEQQEEIDQLNERLERLEQLFNKPKNDE